LQVRYQHNSVLLLLLLAAEVLWYASMLLLVLLLHVCVGVQRRGGVVWLHA
jgi:hypothetical protein